MGIEVEFHSLHKGREMSAMLTSLCQLGNEEDWPVYAFGPIRSKLIFLWVIWGQGQASLDPNQADNVGLWYYQMEEEYLLERPLTLFQHLLVYTLNTFNLLHMKRWSQAKQDVFLNTRLQLASMVSQFANYKKNMATKCKKKNSPIKTSLGVSFNYYVPKIVVLACAKLKGLLILFSSFSFCRFYFVSYSGHNL